MVVGKTMTLALYSLAHSQDICQSARICSRLCLKRFFFCDLVNFLAEVNTLFHNKELKCRRFMNIRL